MIKLLFILIGFLIGFIAGKIYVKKTFYYVGKKKFSTQDIILRNRK